MLCLLIYVIFYKCIELISFKDWNFEKISNYAKHYKKLSIIFPFRSLEAVISRYKVEQIVEGHHLGEPVLKVNMCHFNAIYLYYNF